MHTAYRDTRNVNVFKYGILAERLRQWIANPSFRNGWVGSIPTYSAINRGNLWMQKH